MDLDRIVDIFPVAAGHHRHDGNFAVVTLTHHVRIALAEPGRSVEREAGRDVAHPEIVGRGLVGQDVGDDATTGQLGQHLLLEALEVAVEGVPGIKAARAATQLSIQVQVSCQT